MPVSAPYDPVFDAIQGYLGYTDISNGSWVSGEWDPALAVLLYENEGDGPPAGEVSSWVQIVLDTHLYGQESIGAGTQAENRWDEDGTLWFHVFTPKGTGSREPRRLGKALANLFRGTVLAGGLEFGDADMGAGDPGKENGNYYLLSVSIDWRVTDAT